MDGRLWAELLQHVERVSRYRMSRLNVALGAKRVGEVGDGGLTVSVTDVATQIGDRRWL